MCGSKSEQVVSRCTRGYPPTIVFFQSSQIAKMSSSSCVISGRGSTVVVNGMTITDDHVKYSNGKRVKLPKHNSVSVQNGDIFLDGKKFKPTARKFIKQTYDLTLEQGTELKELYIENVSDVIITNEVEYSAKLVCNKHNEHDVRVGHIVLHKEDNANEHSTLEVCIPEGMILNLVLKNAKNVKIEHVTFWEMEIKKVSNMVEMEDVIATNMKVGGLDCNISLTKIYAEEMVQLHTAHGDIEVENMIAVMVSATSTGGGCVELDDVNISGHVSISTTTGDVEVSGRGNTMTLQSTSGYLSVEGEFTRVCADTVSGNLYGEGPIKVSFITTDGHNRYKQIKEEEKQ
jgi:hypothetical protein